MACVTYDVENFPVLLLLFLLLLIHIGGGLAVLNRLSYFVLSTVSIGSGDQAVQDIFFRMSPATQVIST